MGTKLDSSRSCLRLGGCLAPPCVQCLDPKESKDHKDDGRMRIKWLSHSPRMACGHERPAAWAQEWVIWDVLPAWWKSTRWDKVPHIAQVAHPVASTRETDHCVPPAGYLASRLFPPDLVPRPEAYRLFFFL